MKVDKIETKKQDNLVPGAVIATGGSMVFSKMKDVCKKVLPYAVAAVGIALMVKSSHEIGGSFMDIIRRLDNIDSQTLKMAGEGLLALFGGPATKAILNRNVKE